MQSNLFCPPALVLSRERNGEGGARFLIISILLHEESSTWNIRFSKAAVGMRFRQSAFANWCVRSNETDQTDRTKRTGGSRSLPTKRVSANRRSQMALSRFRK